MFKVILWASDGSEHSDRALDYARKLAEAESAELVAAHIREITTGRSAGYPVLIDEDEIETKIQGQAKDLADAGINARYEQAGAAYGGAANAESGSARHRRPRTCGWGMIPATIRIGATAWTTALFPKDGHYLVPIKARARQAEPLVEGDTVMVCIEV